MEKNKEKIIEEIKKEIAIINENKTFIIVEGKKDKNSLLEIGLKNIIILKGSIYSFCENIAKKHKEIIILTDLDSEGKKLYSKIKENLEKNHVKVNDNLRLKLFNSEIRHIEGLNNYLKNFKES